MDGNEDGPTLGRVCGNEDGSTWVGRLSENEGGAALNMSRASGKEGCDFVVFGRDFQIVADGWD